MDRDIAAEATVPNPVFWLLATWVLVEALLVVKKVQSERRQNSDNEGELL